MAIKRRTGVTVRLSDAEVMILERVMVERGLRRRGRTFLWALLEVAGERERAQSVIPHAARRRALKRDAA